jgi:hypothetical protein
MSVGASIPVVSAAAWRLFFGSGAFDCDFATINTTFRTTPHQHTPTLCLTNTSARPATPPSKLLHPLPSSSPLHPHPHTNTAPSFDLPPTARATPLPVGKGRTAQTSARTKKRKIAHVEGYGQDDTPKAFARLMAFSANGAAPAKPKKRSGLDDGLVQTKKQKRAAALAASSASNDQQQQQQQQQLAAKTAEAQAKAIPKIQPGESMAEFSQRVDAALPLAGISKTTKKITGGAPDRRITKHEKRLKRLQAGWREEEARIRDKEDEARELAEEDDDEAAALWEDKTADLDADTNKLRPNGKKAKKKPKRKMVVGEVDDSDDEWEKLQRRRDAQKQKGVHDVVSAPPTFTRVPREIFKVKNGAKVNVDNVPASAGSLRKREELGEERKTIIDTYRELMAKRKEGAKQEAK